MLKQTTTVGLVILLTGCAPTAELTKYSPPSGKPTASVLLIALDEYRESDAIHVFLVSRYSCQEKPMLTNITSIGASGLLGKDSHKAEMTLPAGEPLNLQISNRSNSSSAALLCKAIKSVTLDAGKQYALKVHNWSSKGSKQGFGCEFNLVELIATGEEKRPATLRGPTFTQCP